ncbi:aldehyde dehydrogenase family protein [Roseateles sp.]|uniref:aldehyde dehydrogenase family protein n=1 Tax=Roseateles sp. TaxID=1971397 RepID=UPI00286D61E1|nr:aldehyde dehydrogenase family protein [Roseateles sp.]
MLYTDKFYIDGKWVPPANSVLLKDVLNPATEEVIAQVALGTAEDVNRAVKAARRAFDSCSRTDPAARVAILGRIAEVYQRRSQEVADLMTQEVGIPSGPSLALQTGIAFRQLEQTIASLASMDFDLRRGTSMITHEPIGVCGLITPWNAPMIQIVCKVAPAIAAGCTMVLKPSELAPLNAAWFADVLDEAKVPAGVFNLVQGDGETVGATLSAHPDVDMISFTGSTRAGIAVAKAAADTVKRVTQELGGKSANVVLPDADFESVIPKGVMGSFRNSGQSCIAPTRMLVPRARLDDVVRIAKATAEGVVVGDPKAADTILGPVANRAQYDKVQRMIGQAIEEGAQLVAGGPGRPTGLTCGYYVRPTVFVCKPGMTIARDEVFGPVLVILAYQDEDDAVRIANDNPYGLGGYVQSADPERARRVARRLRTGRVDLNYPAYDPAVPYGGYKQSGNGREYADFGIREYLETKSILGYSSV